MASTSVTFAGEHVRGINDALSGPQLERWRKMLSYKSMRTTMSTKGQIVLPAALRAADGLKPGEEFEIDRLGPDEYRLTRITPPPNRGVVDWLCSCPERDWFVEIESESTDSL
jgi:AbrB family looped-hinge helix DNA binding protein